MIPTINDIRAVVAIYKRTFLSDAAKDLQVSIYDIARSVERMESFIGEPLFVIDGERTKTTKRGHELCEVLGRIDRTLTTMEKKK